MAYTPVHTYIPGTGMTGTSPVTAWADQTGSSNWSNTNTNSYSSGLLSIPASSLLTATISAITAPYYFALRVKVTDNTSSNIFFSITGGCQFYMNGGTVQPTLTSNGSTFYSSADSFSLNTETNLIALVNGASSKIWINTTADSGGGGDAGSATTGTTLRMHADTSGFSNTGTAFAVGRISIGTASSFDSTDVANLNTWLNLGAGSSGGAYSRATMNGGMRDLTGGMR